MKKIIFLFLAFATFNLKAQNYTPIINYAFNGTPTNGIKINTNIPFQHGYGMPTLIIEGYDYGGSSPIGLILNWYVYNDNFYNHAISSFGNYTPEIKLYNENGKIVIFINDKRYYNRFTIRGYAKSKSEKNTDFEGWTITDELPIGTNETVMAYRNKFAGHVTFTGNTVLPNGIWNSVGNVGIGTSTPSNKLQIGNSFSFHDGGQIVQGFAYAPGRGDLASDKYASELRLDPKNGIFYIGVSSNTTDDPKVRLSINKEGNVGIGTGAEALPSGYKLAIAGKTITEEVKVQLKNNWPDYVFTKEYKLPTLQEVAQHIKKKGHLQNIPSAKEVQKNEGIELGEMNRKLLEKIEELTLYTIQQQREIDELKKENSLLKKLEERINKLENKN
ncbi:hypothetical protein [Tenacibaculum discolor]|uniref:hypothetical protein n=1 Tax=Tenacibaculum discolor TaxID=361581 RepID=UPI003F7AF1A7